MRLVVFLYTVHTNRIMRHISTTHDHPKNLEPLYPYYLSSHYVAITEANLSVFDVLSPVELVPTPCLLRGINMLAGTIAFTSSVLSCRMNVLDGTIAFTAARNQRAHKPRCRHTVSWKNQRAHRPRCLQRSRTLWNQCCA